MDGALAMTTKTAPAAPAAVTSPTAPSLAIGHRPSAVRTIAAAAAAAAAAATAAAAFVTMAANSAAVTLARRHTAACRRVLRLGAVLLAREAAAADAPGRRLWQPRVLNDDGRKRCACTCRQLVEVENLEQACGGAHRSEHIAEQGHILDEPRPHRLAACTRCAHTRHAWKLCGSCARLCEGRDEVVFP
eukprot:6210032-Pleurochrysis_carterae.AAC.5